MSHLYVCHFSNGHIKVGRSIEPKARIAQHEDRVACMGIELIEHHIEECVGPSEPREAELIRRCIAAASQRFQNEWFAGLDYLDVCEWAGQAARLEIASGPVWRALFLRRDGFQTRLTKKYGIPAQTVSNWRTGIPPEYCARVEQECNGEFRRWHFRQNDWHLIWPELIGVAGAPAIQQPAHPIGEQA